MQKGKTDNEVERVPSMFAGAAEQSQSFVACPRFLRIGDIAQLERTQETIEGGGVTNKVDKLPEQNLLRINMQRSFAIQVRCQCGKVLQAELMVADDQHEDHPLRVVPFPCPKCLDDAHAKGFRDALTKEKELRANNVLAMTKKDVVK